MARATIFSLTHGLLLLLCLAALSAPSLSAAEKNKEDRGLVAATVAKAGPDYAVQGEYLAETQAFDVQVIAES